jgi:hypothetical protein
MTIKIASWQGIGSAVLVLIGLAATPAWSAEQKVNETVSIVRTIDLDECEPIKIRAKIMEVNSEKGTLVVVEREIREIDFDKGGQRVKTSYLNIEGKPEPRAAFRPGQYVLVKGFQHPDGFMVASVVQKIEKPAEKKTSYKPVVEGQRASRRNSAAARPR